MLDQTKLVGHRGEMQACPENTLLAIRTAIEAGAQFVEFDIQLSLDQVPVLFHDVDLKRLTHVSGTVTQFLAADLSAIRVRHPNMQPNREEDSAIPEDGIPRLSDVVKLINQTPEVTAFVEIKRQSLDEFGLHDTVDSVVNALQQAKFPWVIISFRDDAIDYAKQAYTCKTGWVLSTHSADSRQRAIALETDYLFCNVTRLTGNQDDYWRGNWHWVIYDIMNIGQASLLHQRGAHLIETGAITRMIRDLEAP